MNCDVKEGEEIGWVRTENGWVLQDSGSKHGLSATMNEDETEDADMETGNDVPDHAHSSLRRFLTPSMTLACSLGLLCVLSRFNLVFMLSSVALIATFVDTILVTVCHLYQIVRSRPIANPFQAFLDLDMSSVIFIAIVPFLSRAICFISGFAETLRRAYLFRSLLNSLKLILVTGICYAVGDWFTVPRLVVTLNLGFFLSQLEITRHLQSSTLFSKVFRRFF